MKQLPVRQSMTCATLYANKQRSEAGFTLLEMMLALAIFAGLSLAGMQLLQGGIRSSEQTRRNSTELTALQKSLWLLEQDLRQMVIRTAQSGGNRSVLSVHRQTRDPSLSVTFLRRHSGLPTEGGSSSGIIQVEWQWQQGKLMRRSWPYGGKAETAGMLMMEAVSHFDIRLLPRGDGTTLPAAVRIVLETPKHGKLERTLLLMETL